MPRTIFESTTELIKTHIDFGPITFLTKLEDSNTSVSPKSDVHSLRRRADGMKHPFAHVGGSGITPLIQYAVYNTIILQKFVHFLLPRQSLLLISGHRTCQIVIMT